MIRKAEAEWKGNLTQGSGRLTVGSGALDVPYSFKSRLEEGQSATNPEELLGAAHAGCFTMALSALLSTAGFSAPARVPACLRFGRRVKDVSSRHLVGDNFTAPSVLRSRRRGIR